MPDLLYELVMSVDCLVVPSPVSDMVPGNS